MQKLKNLFLVQYQNKKKEETSFTTRNYVKTLFFLLIIGLLFLAFWQTNFLVNIKGMQVFKKNLQEFLKISNYDASYPSNSIFENSLFFMWKTFLFTILGTFVGFSLAFLTSVLSSRLLFSKFITFFVELVTIFLRSFPALVIIFAIKNGFEKSLAASLVLVWFSWLWSSRYLQDIFNNSSLTLLNFYLQKGYNKIGAFYKSVISLNLNKIIMIFFFSLEANLRFSAILGSFSLPGIGQLINDNFQQNNYQNLAIPILLIVSVIFVFELLIFALNRWVFADSTKIANSKYTKESKRKNFNWKNGVKISLLVFFVCLCIYQLVIIKYNFSLFNGLINYVKTLFAPDLSLWQKGINTNPWIDVFKLLLNGLVIIFISFFVSLVFSFFCCSRIMKPYVFLPCRTINIFLRSIPTLIIFIFLNPLFFDQTTIGIISICFGTSSVLVKQFSESFNAVSYEKIQIYRKRGKTLFWIFIFFMVFEVKKDLYTYTYFAYNNALRALVVLGVFGVSTIGSTINGFQQRNLVFKIASYVWPLVITFFTLELIPVFKFYFKNYKTNKKNNHDFDYL